MEDDILTTIVGGVSVLLFAASVATLISCGHTCVRNKWLRTALSTAKREKERAVDIAKSELRAQYESAYEQKVSDMAVAFDRANIKVACEELRKPSVVALAQSIRAVAEKRYNRMAQLFGVKVTDKAEAAAADFMINVCDKVWNSYQKYRQIDADALILMPEGTRMVQSKGNRTVLVVEQKPQRRTVTLHANLMKRSESEHAAGKCAAGYRFNLAFPYTYFVMVFDDDKFKWMEHYVRNKPLTSAREYFFDSPLPNLHTDTGSPRKVCMGGNFLNEVVLEKSVARQANMAVAEFWQIPFNSDLGRSKDQIADFATWQKNSDEDPLFVLSLDWKQARTVKGTVESIMDKRAIPSGGVDRFEYEIKHTIHDGVAKVADAVKHIMQEAKLKDAPDFAPDVSEAMTNTIKKHSEQVFNTCFENL